MSSPHPPFVPTAGDGEGDEVVIAVPTVEDDGERVIDPDIEGDAIDSARADRIAAGARDEDEIL